MKERKNIDRLFQEKFKDFEAHPSDAVWEKIAFAKAEKENKKVIPLWWRLGGIAAALALLLGLGSLFFNPAESEPTIVDTSTETPAETNPVEKTNNNFSNLTEQVAQEQTAEDQINASTSQNGSVTASQGIVDSNDATQENNTRRASQNEYNTTSQEDNAVATQDRSNQNERSPMEEGKARATNNFNTNKATASNDDVPSKNDARLLNDSDISTKSETINPNLVTPKESNKTAVAENETEDTKTDNGKSLIDVAQEIEDKQDEAVTVINDTTRDGRWDVGAVAAPVYYGDFGGSGIDPQFKDNGKNGDVNLSYGVQVSYAVSDKLKVRTGVSNLDLSYGTNNISFTPDISASRLSGVDYNKNARFLSVTDQVRNSDQLPTAESSDFQGGGTSASNGSLQQSIGYIEVPVEAVYTLSDNRLGVEVIGGVSTLFLNDNEIAIESQDGLRTPIGESNSLNDISFTTNVGVGVNYKITDKVKVNVEPTLKYQLNAFDGAAADFKPYYIGLYTGVSYRF